LTGARTVDTVAAMAGRWEADLDAARQAALAGGAVVAAGFRSASRRTRKGPHDVVTQVDRDSERRIFATLREHGPHDARLGEESGLRRSRAQRAGDLGRADVGRVWIVDPLDGTISFASGLPFFCVSVALAVDGTVVCGVIHDPIHGETVAAIRGGGAWLEPDHRPVRPRRLARLEDAVVSADLGDAPDAAAVQRFVEIRTRVRAVRTMGSTALSVTYAALGRLDGVWQATGLAAVDVAAAGLIASEAGLRITDGFGGRWLDLAEPWRGAGIAVGSPGIHRLLVPRHSPPGSSK
jgi:myo-inositol-1(or 4)-monophosphatase